MKYLWSIFAGVSSTRSRIYIFWTEEKLFSNFSFPWKKSVSFCFPILHIHKFRVMHCCTYITAWAGPRGSYYCGFNPGCRPICDGNLRDVDAASANKEKFIMQFNRIGNKTELAVAYGSVKQGFPSQNMVAWLLSWMVSQSTTLFQKYLNYYWVGYEDIL